MQAKTDPSSLTHGPTPNARILLILVVVFPYKFEVDRTTLLIIHLTDVVREKRSISRNNGL